MMPDEYIPQPERAKDIVASEEPKIILYDAKGRPLVRAIGFRGPPTRVETKKAG